ncbi:MAG: ankyrin repeat domain-containing protein, partial [Methanosarcinales archaeon]
VYESDDSESDSDDSESNSDDGSVKYDSDGFRRSRKGRSDNSDCDLDDGDDDSLATDDDSSFTSDTDDGDAHKEGTSKAHKRNPNCTCGNGGVGGCEKCGGRVDKSASTALQGMCTRWGGFPEDDISDLDRPEEEAKFPLNATLYAAVRGGNVAALLAALEDACDVHASGGRRLRPLSLAAKLGAARAVKELSPLVSERFKEYTVRGKYSPLQLCARSGSVLAISVLHSKFFTSPAHDADHVQPCLMAVIKGHAAAAAMLLPTGHLNDWTLLHTLALQEGATAHEVHATGDKLNDKESTLGLTPLHVAASCGHVATVTTLLQAGARVGSVSYHHQQAMHFAARNGHAEVVNLLVSRTRSGRRK